MKNIIVIALISFVFFAGLTSAVEYQYGMMDSGGQFYPAGQTMMGSGYGMMGMMNMMAGYGSYNFGIMLLSWITYLAILALIIAGVYWLVKTANRKR